MMNMRKKDWREWIVLVSFEWESMGLLRRMGKIADTDYYWGVVATIAFGYVLRLFLRFTWLI